MQKSSIAKYSLSVALFILLVAIVFIPSRFPAQSQGSFTPTPTTTPTPETIESDFEYVSQVGQWTSQAASSASGGSYLYSSGSVDDTLTLEFEGTTVTVIYVEGPSLGTFAIEIDNTVVRTVITTSSTTNYNVQAVVDYLASDRHTLRVYPVQGMIAVDAFVAIPTYLTLVLPPQTPPPSGGDGGASGTADGSQGVWATWAEGDFDFDAVYTPSSGCPAPDDTTTRNVLLSGGLYAEVDTASEFEQAIAAANASEATTPYLICITTATPLTLINPLVIDKSVNIYGQLDRLSLGQRQSAFLVRGANFGANALITIHPGAVVEISHLGISSSDGVPLVDIGGGIRNQGKLSIFDSRIHGWAAHIAGGAIQNTGSLYIARSDVSYNAVTRRSSPGGSSGGAVYNDYGGVFIAHCDSFYYNWAYTAGGAILNGEENQSSVLHLWRSDFRHNDVTNIRDYYLLTHGDILNGKLTNSDGKGGPFATGSNAHYSYIAWAYGIQQVFNPVTSYPVQPSPLLDPICAPQHPPRQTQEEAPFCIVKVTVPIEAYLSPVSARTEHIASIKSFDISTVEYEEPLQEFGVGVQLRLEYRYRYESQGDLTDDSVFMVTQYNDELESNEVDVYDPDHDGWKSPTNAGSAVNVWVYKGQVWIDGISQSRLAEVAEDIEGESLGDCNLPANPHIARSHMDSIDLRHYYIEELRSFGIEPQDYGNRFPNTSQTLPLTRREWSADELAVILQATSDTADAFLTLTEFQGQQSKDVFRRIMNPFTVVRAENGSEAVREVRVN